MSVITVDSDLLTKLASASGPVAMCGPDGRQVGYFTPVHMPHDFQLKPQISEDEIARRVADRSARTFTTAEVLAKLESLK